MITAKILIIRVSHDYKIALHMTTEPRILESVSCIYLVTHKYVVTGELYKVFFHWLGPLLLFSLVKVLHDDVIKWKHFPRYWPFVRGIHRSPVNSPHKSQWHGALVLSLICAWTNGWANHRHAGDLRRHRAHYDVNVMVQQHLLQTLKKADPRHYINNDL